MKSRSSVTDSLQDDIAARLERAGRKKPTGRFWAMTDGPWGRFSSLLHFSPSPRAAPNGGVSVVNEITPRARTVIRLNPPSLSPCRQRTNLLICAAGSSKG